MSAADLLSLVNQLLFVLVFVAVLVHALRRPRRSTIDAVLLFGDIALLVAVAWTLRALGLTAPPWLSQLNGALLIATAYLFLRLVAGFADVPALVMRAAELGLGLTVLGLFLVPAPTPVGLTLAYVAYYVLVLGYATWLAMRAARRSAGVTRRRLMAVSFGSICLALLILLAGLGAALPGLAPLWSVITPALGFASGLGYILGFATPLWLRRAWQEPELRSFLARAAALTRLPDTPSVARAIEDGAAAALGAAGASVGLWDESIGKLRFEMADGPVLVAPGEMDGGEVFAAQRPIFAPDARRRYPAYADRYAAYNVLSTLAAPITAGERRLGVLVVYTDRAPVFAEDDLGLVQLFADQAAVILESRSLIDEAARVRAEAEANRLREDFLSAAAHDLKTPLTTVVGRVQLLRRRLERMVDVPPAALEDADAVVRESQRLRGLVLDLLDASRIEQGSLVGHRDVADLVQLAREVCERRTTTHHAIDVAADAPVVGAFDAARISQLIENLVENAVKYSPEGGPIVITVRSEGERAHLSVSDRGIGIPPADLPRLFERFRRASNVDDRRFAGLGLGLYICRGIAEGHGGRMWAESAPGQGATFHVELPLRAEAKAA